LEFYWGSRYSYPRLGSRLVGICQQSVADGRLYPHTNLGLGEYWGTTKSSRKLGSDSRHIVQPSHVHPTADVTPFLDIFRYFKHIIMDSNGFD
jgi:hypothetical protein